MAGRSAKKTTGTKRKGSIKARKTQAQEQVFIYEIIAVCVFAISIFMLLSLFGIGAVFGRALKQFQLGSFGLLGYVFPLVFFTAYLFWIANRKNTLVKWKISAGLAMYFLAAAFAHVFSSRELNGVESLLEAYRLGEYGGVTGILLGGALRHLIGRVGTALLILALLLICYLFISGISFLDIVNHTTNLFYTRTKEDFKRFRQQRQEQRRIRQTEDEEEQERRETKEDRGFIRGIRLMDAEPDIEERLKNRKEAQEQKAEKASPAWQPVRVQNLSETAGKEEHLAAEPYMAEDFSFATPEESKIIKQEDMFTGIIINANAKKEGSREESLDEETIVRASSILKRKEELEEALPEKLPQPSLSIENEDEEEEDFSFVEEFKQEPEPSLTPEAPLLQEIEEEKNDREAGVPKFVQTPASGERQVVTASGKHISAESAGIKKEAEIKDLRKYEKPMSAKEKKVPVQKPYVFPPTSLLKKEEGRKVFSEEEYKQTAIKLQQTLHNFGVSVRVTNISCGPVVTRYELSPEQGVKVSKIVALQDDIKLSLAASDIRIEAPIPGKSAVGIEVPNKENNTVYFRELLESEQFKAGGSRLAFAVGKDITGQTVVTDIAKMPHLLIAGATGSGKSVCINTLIMSILYRYSPEDVKLIMVDPKVVELSVYNTIPHLLIPVVTDPKKAAASINWAVAEMTERYKKFARAGVRDLRGYNEKIEKTKQRGEEEQEESKLPQIVIIIDELADLMMVAQNEVEDAICRLAQLARACGIHLVIATQRPSVNVITGLIKANIPSRIAFAVTSGVDSRTILDTVGAEKLLGKGDMLFSPQGSPKPMRVQGAFISDGEVQAVVDFIRQQEYVASYDASTLEKIESSASLDGKASGSDVDELFMQAGRLIIDKEKASIGILQRAFKIGFNRAARIMDQLYEAGVVGSEQGTKPRDILMDMETFEEIYGD